MTGHAGVASGIGYWASRMLDSAVGAVKQRRRGTRGWCALIDGFLA